MRITKTIGAAIAALLATNALPACAQPAPQAANDADPALWVVKDADTTIYLFGTVHVLKPGLTWFDEAVKTAFDGSQELVLEVIQPTDQAAAQQLFMTKGMTPPDTPALTEQLPEDKRAAFAQALTDNGLPASVADRMKPWFAGLTLSMIPLVKLGYDPTNGPEMVLTAAAKKEGKTVGALETVEQQLGFFDTLPKEAQIAFLTSTVDELPNLAKTMDEMVVDWSKGDPKALGDLLNENLDESPELAKAILFDRNARWADWIKTRLDKPGAVFIAVGAGHLAGKNSVQDYLAQRKLTAERVAY